MAEREQQGRSWAADADEDDPEPEPEPERAAGTGRGGLGDRRGGDSDRWESHRMGDRGPPRDDRGPPRRDDRGPPSRGGDDGGSWRR